MATIVQVNGSIPSYESAKLLVREDGSMIGTVGGGCVEAEVWTAAREVIETEKPRHLNFSLGEDAAYDNGLICGGQLNIFVEPVMPQPRAFIFGGGHVSKSISKVANLAGFATVDHRRPRGLRQQRALPGSRRTYAEEYEDVFPEAAHQLHQLHHHRHARPSRRYARAALGGEHAGQIHRHDRQQAQDHLRGEGAGKRRPRRARLFEKIFAPMGLEIGAETPEEIAISVVAEMIAVRRAPDADWRQLSKSIFAHDRLKALLK